MNIKSILELEAIIKMGVKMLDEQTFSNMFDLIKKDTIKSIVTNDNTLRIIYDGIELFEDQKKQDIYDNMDEQQLFDLYNENCSGEVMTMDDLDNVNESISYMCQCAVNGNGFDYCDSYAFFDRNNDILESSNGYTDFFTFEDLKEYIELEDNIDSIEVMLQCDYEELGIASWVYVNMRDTTLQDFKDALQLCVDMYQVTTGEVIIEG